MASTRKPGAGKGVRAARAETPKRASSKPKEVLAKKKPALKRARTQGDSYSQENPSPSRSSANDRKLSNVAHAEPFPFNSPPPVEVNPSTPDKAPFKGILSGVKVESVSTSAAERLGLALQDMDQTPTGKMIVDYYRNNSKIIRVKDDLGNGGTKDAEVLGHPTFDGGIEISSSIPQDMMPAMIGHETQHIFDDSIGNTLSFLLPGNQPSRQEYFDEHREREASAQQRGIDVSTELARLGLPSGTAEEELYTNAYHQGLAEFDATHSNATEAQRTEAGRQAGYRALIEELKKSDAYNQHFDHGYTTVDNFYSALTAVQGLGALLPAGGGILGALSYQPNATKLNDPFRELERLSKNAERDKADQ